MSWAGGIGAALVFGVTLICVPALADLAADQEAAIHLKVLSFDRTLGDRAGKSIVIGVLYQAGAESSESSAVEIVEAFESLGRKKVRIHGKRITAIAVPIGKKTADAIAEGSVDVVYLVDVPSDKRAGAVETASGLGLPTLCGRRAYVEEGIAVAVVAKNGKPRIVVNVEAAKRDGMSLDPKLLRLAEIIK
jgi:hypothetical protein